MDSLAHAVLGAALCSQTGIAGGLRGPINRTGQPCLWHWSVPAAAFFGIFPDLVSIGIYIIPRLFSGHQMWHTIPDYIFTLYHMSHSLIIASLAIVLCMRLKRPLVIPMLAWPLHIICDMYTHGTGRFQTPILYPLSDFHVNGINWWQHRWITVLTWSIALLLWTSIIAVRLRAISLQKNTRHHNPDVDATTA